MLDQIGVINLVLFINVINKTTNTMNATENFKKLQVLSF